MIQKAVQFTMDLARENGKKIGLSKLKQFPIKYATVLGISLLVILSFTSHLILTN